MNANPEGTWVVVWTSPRAEKKVDERLDAQGIVTWLPKFTERRRWSDRWREVVLPLFPGYLFARCDEHAISRLLRTPGVLTVVKTGPRPALVSDAFIAGLRQAVEQSGITSTPVAEEIEFNINDQVIVNDGPLAGVRGFVREIRRSRQLVIWVQEIGRGVAFTIGTARVSPVAP